MVRKLSRNWTDNQKKAIEARNMQILVSAAAGSGKTSVLTERVKRILCDTENPCAVSEILVVTFTRAAANEMRDRIYKALGDEIENNNENSDYLRRQMTLLPTADICTMDSFCAKLVRENFHLADVGADFKILDEKDEKELMKYAVKDVVDGLYEENDPDFLALSEMFLSERDDVKLEEIIENLYTFSRSYPSPSLWLDEITEKFSHEKDPFSTGWVDYCAKYLSMFADFYYHRLRRCVALIEDDSGNTSNYNERFNMSAENLRVLKELLDKKDWDSAINHLRNGLVVKPRLKGKNDIDEELKTVTEKVFGSFEDNLKSINNHTLPLLSEHKEDCETLYPIVKKLCEAVKRLTNSLDEMKKERNSYGFDDVLHKAIDLLAYFSDGEVKKTPLAEELTAKYKEILIDEYQDTNKAQNTIFEIISRDRTNLYTVGDVKQSIYGFRLASPDLFMDLKGSLSDYDGENKPSQIILENNFRSREGITKSVNAVFSNIMSKEMGEIDYNEKEYLNYSAKYSEKSTPDLEIVCVNADNKDEFAPTEPETVAKYIRSIINSGVTVKDENGERKVRFGDFCILLRSAKGKMGAYADELKKLSIPVTSSADSEAALSKEIQFLTSLVKVVNNPLIDIPLISVLISPVFGFTPDELSKIRTIDRKADFYVCLSKYAEDNKKAKDFLQKIQLYRNISATYPIDEFVRFIVNDTAVSDIYYAAGEGDIRNANIKGFLKLSKDFCDSGRKGLSDFVRYIDIAAEKDGMKSRDGGLSDDNSVKIMSIHKSKGLEFPYVIIADTSKGFNKQDAYKQMVLSKETGVGMRIRNDNLFTRYHSLSSNATENAILFSSISEELRVLYVAMTRAKEHLTFFINVCDNTLPNRVKLNHLLKNDYNDKLHPYAVFRAGSMAEWVLSCLSNHPDGAIIRDIFGIPSYSFSENSDFRFDCSYIKTRDDDFTVEDIKTDEIPVNEELLTEIRNNIEYVYPFDYSGILAKRTASSTESTRQKRTYFGTAKPRFLNEKFSGADRGTAVHKFLELCDFNSAYKDFEGEKARLKNAYLITEEELQVLDENAVRSFFNSDVGSRLLASDEVLKEYEFAIFKNAKELYEDLPETAKDEKIVVQGKLDCAFKEKDGFVLVDYKTDNVTDENYFVSVYKNQLEIYADALYQCTEIPVKEIYIYSFKLNKFIKIY